MHLGASPDAESIDPDKECHAAGQGIGGIAKVVPAGDLVHRIVEEAERALHALGSLRAVRT